MGNDEFIVEVDGCGVGYYILVAAEIRVVIVG